MKKVIAFFITLLAFPIFANAAEYDEPAFYVDAKVLENGDMEVKEYLFMDGQFHGNERIILFRNSRLSDWEPKKINFEQSGIYNASNIRLHKVSAKKVSKVSKDIMKEDFPAFQRKGNPQNGESGVFSMKTIQDGITIRTYEDTEDDITVFYYEYTIKDAVVIHEDVAELYWQFIGNDFWDDIRDVSISVALPKASSKDAYRIWAHGPLQGEVKPLGEYEGATLEVRNLQSETPVDLRMTFEKEMITEESTLDHSEQTALAQIEEVEKERAKEADEQREKAKNAFHLATAMKSLYLVGLAIITIYIYVKYDKERKSTFASKYYREFIDDYDVEVIDYLFHRNITSNAMSASILNLVYKKKIQVEEIESGKKEKEYRFTLKNEADVSDAEKYLIKFLFEDVGNGKEFTTKELKKYAEGTNSYSKFQTSYNTWKHKVELEGTQQEFFDNLTKIKVYAILYGILGICLIVIGMCMGLSALTFYSPTKFVVELVLDIVLIFATVAFLIYAICFQRKTAKGIDHYKKWTAFKNFLDDFGTFDTKELPEIVLWERYLVYAVILGVADKVQKAMNVKINELDPDGTIYSNTLYTHLYMDNLTTSISRSVNTAIQSNMSAAISSSSSSSGFGGGFSSGGGFGGGGGGSHGF